MKDRERRLTEVRVDALARHAKRHGTILFQSVFDLRTGEFVGVEALARFAFGRHTLRPDIFINQAHEIGRGAEVEMAVLRLGYSSAMRLAEELHTGRPLHVSFNVSGVAADSNEFHEFLDEVPPLWRPIAKP